MFVTINTILSPDIRKSISTITTVPITLLGKTGTFSAISTKNLGIFGRRREGAHFKNQIFHTQTATHMYVL
jgi:hypothetical protein